MREGLERHLGEMRSLPGEEVRLKGRGRRGRQVHLTTREPSMNARTKKGIMVNEEIQDTLSGVSGVACASMMMVERMCFSMSVA